MWQVQSLQMEWCLGCHRHPEQLRPAARGGVQRGLHAADHQLELGKAGGRDSKNATSDELFDVPPLGRARSVASEPVDGLPTHVCEFQRIVMSARSTPSTGIRPRPAERVRGRSSGGASRSWPTTPLSSDFARTASSRPQLEWLRPVGRRTFLKLMGASLALAGVTRLHAGSRTRRSSPTSASREEIVPGKPLFFATAMTLGGVAIRPAGREPRGSADEGRGQPAAPREPRRHRRLRARRSVLRSTIRTAAGDHAARARSSTWTAFVGGDAGRDAEHSRRARAPGLRILTESVSVADAGRSVQRALGALPAGPVAPVGASGRAARADGLEAWPSAATSTCSTAFDEADVILALDADFLGCGPGSLRYARDFASRRPHRRPRGTHEPALRGREHAARRPGARPITGWPLRPSQMAAFAARGWRPASACGRAAPAGLDASLQPHVAARGRRTSAEHRGKSVVVAGDQQPPAVHALAHAMNAALGNVGTTVVYTDPVEANPVDHVESLRDAGRRHGRGQGRAAGHPGRQPGVHGAGRHPVQGEARARWPCGSIWRRTSTRRPPSATGTCPRRTTSRPGATAARTTARCRWSQPLIAPLYDGKSAHDLLAAFSAEPSRSGYDVVRGYWRKQFAAGPSSRCRRPKRRRSRSWPARTASRRSSCSGARC